MRILFVHNYYREQGGEDVSFHNEMDLLARHGHQVEMYTRDNHEIQEGSIVAKIQLFRETSWSQKTVVDIQEKIRDFQPADCSRSKFLSSHFPIHLFGLQGRSGFLLFSACGITGSCVSNGLFFRDGHPCEDCMGKSFPYPGVLHACYRNSLLQTLAVASMLRIT